MSTLTGSYPSFFSVEVFLEVRFAQKAIMSVRRSLNFDQSWIILHSLVLFCETRRNQFFSIRVTVKEDQRLRDARTRAMMVSAESRSI